MVGRAVRCGCSTSVLWHLRSSEKEDGRCRLPSRPNLSMSSCPVVDVSCMVWPWTRRRSPPWPAIHRLRSDGALRAQRLGSRASERDERGSRGPKGDLQGKAREDGTRAGQGVRRSLRLSLSEGRLRFRGGNRRCPELPELSGEPPRQATHDEHAGAALSGGEEQDEGSRGVPQRGECEHAGHGDSLEEQRAVGAETLPHDGRPRGAGKTEPTTFETLTSAGPTRYGSSRS